MNIKHILDRVLHHLIIFLVSCTIVFVLLGCVFVIDYGIQNTKSHERYFLYDKITVEDAPKGQPFTVVSHVQYFQPVWMVWKDTLFCDFYDGEGFQNIHTLESPKVYKEASPDNNPQQIPWKFTEKVPNKPATCYIRAVPESHFRYGVYDFQIIVTNEFKLY